MLGFLSAVLVVSAGLVMAAWLTLAAPVKSAAGTPTSPLAVKSAAESTPVASLGSPAAGSVANAPLRFVLVPERSEVRYRVREQLATLSLPSDAVGATRALAGAITLAPSGAVVREQSGIEVDLRTVRSDSSRRDAFLQRSTLEVNRFPTAELVPTEVRGLPSPLPTAGEVTFQLVGDLTVRGITRPTTWQATARIAGPEVAGSASTSFRFDDIGLTKPRVASVLSVEDTIRLEIDFVFTRAPSPSS